MKPKLYTFWRSSCSWRVRWVLAIKGIEFEPVYVDIIKGETQAPAFLAKNPNGYLPALEIDGKVLVESLAILEYLEETRGGTPLIPKDPWARARMRQLVSLVHSGIQPLQNTSILDRVESIGGKKKEWAAHFNRRGLVAYEAMLETIHKELGTSGPFSLGAEMTLADIFLVPQVYSARDRYGADVSDLKRVLAAEAAAMATPHADGARPEKQPDRS